MTAPADQVRCDVALTISSVSFDIAHHIDAKTTLTEEQLSRLLERLYRAHRAYLNLESACEDLIEDGYSEERLKAMEFALARAQGQDSYSRRKDRW